jgi:hypothetical protein
VYSVEQFPDGTREAVLSVDGLVFRSRKNVDSLYPDRPIPGMDLWIFFASNAAPGDPDGLSDMRRAADRALEGMAPGS